MWIQLAIFVLSVVISYSTRVKATTPKASVLGDFDFPQGTEGTAQMMVFGDCWIDGWMVLGVGDFRTQPIRR